MDFHERVRHQYLRLADAEPDRIVVIDAVGTVDEVFSEIRGVLVERFEGGVATIDEAVDAPAGAPAPEESAASAESFVPEAATERSAPSVPEAAREHPASSVPEAATEASAPRTGPGEQRSSRKPATMVGALGESQGALWDE